MFGNDDFIFVEPVGVRQVNVFIWIAARDTGGRGVRHCRRAPGGDDAPFRAGQLRQARSHALHQLVQLHHVLGGRIHGRANLGQFERSAVHRQRPGAVDEGADANRLIDVGSDAQRAGPERAGSRPLGRRLAQKRKRQHTAALEEIAPGERHAPSYSCARSLSRSLAPFKKGLLALMLAKVRRDLGEPFPALIARVWALAVLSPVQGRPIIVCVPLAQVSSGFHEHLDCVQ